MTPLILQTRLKLGGVWYLRGHRVSLPEADAAVLVGRGIAVHELETVDAEDMVNTVQEKSSDPVRRKERRNGRY